MWDRTDPPTGRWAELGEELSAQLAAAAAADRRVQAAELARGELSAVRLVDRLRGATGRELVLHVEGAGAVRGRAVGAGEGWLLLRDRQSERVVLLVACLSVAGAGTAVRGDPVVSPVEARWGVGAVLRRLVPDRSPVRIVLRSGEVLTGTVDMVGADHLELAEHPLDLPRRAGAVTLRRILPFAGVAVVDRRLPVPGQPSARSAAPENGCSRR